MPSVRQAAPLDELVDDELEDEDELDDEELEEPPPPALPPPLEELLDALVLPPAPLLVLLLLDAPVDPLDWKRSPASRPQPGASSATVSDASAAARQR